MHDAKTALILDGQTNEDSDGWKVSFDEIGSAVKWVNPNNSVLRVESLKVVDRDFILFVVLSEGVLDPVTTISLLSV